uniref:C-type lectin domain-containing protein n=1 Tax=Cyprinus carpio TaxID=7962 RepID=A0A8C1VYD7_CYPCA
ALCVTLTQEKQQFVVKFLQSMYLFAIHHKFLKHDGVGCGRSNFQCTQCMSILSDRSYRQMSVNGDNKLTAELVLLTAGWTYYQYSFYYMSKEQKNWTESRKYCRERGADLIIINNREEQDFVHNTSGNAVFYIGLTDIDVEGTWKWVDNISYQTESSTEHLTLICRFSFWAPNERPTEPNGGKQENCAVTVAVPPREWANLVGWMDVSCDKTYQWICEKRSQFILP